MDKIQLTEYINKEYSNKEICKILNISIGKLRYWLNKFDLTAITEVSRKKDINEMLIEKSPHRRCTIRKRILSENILEYKCDKCSIYNWEGSPLSLHLDHINGINDDHRIENLRFLCPNCHSQTDTYAGRNINKNSHDVVKYIRAKDKQCKCGEYICDESTSCLTCYKHIQNSMSNIPTKEQLIHDLIELSWTGVGRRYGVSDNAIRKWAVKYDLGKDRKKIIEIYKK